MTRGLEHSGIDVVFGVDIDSHCDRTNDNARFVHKSVDALSVSDFSQAFRDNEVTLLAGCAPCQPFSIYQRGKSDRKDERWNLLQHFGRLVKEVKPDLVSMENVPQLEKQDVFSEFVYALEDEGFHVFWKVVNCTDYGVPQERKDLSFSLPNLVPSNL